MSGLTDEQILKLSQDPSFSGSFAGLRTLRRFLYTDYGEHIPLKRLYSIMNKSPDYLMNLRPVRQFTRRHYEVYSFAQLIEADLGFMSAYKKFRYFLLVIDVFSWKIFARPLVSKKALTIRKNLISILDAIGVPVTQLSTGANLIKIFSA